ncbi:ribosomal maturation YjgA family protein [Flavobacterium restrictum]|uniref:DUF2809 domain-containing protein n=1 Tax=Flavobacterium restrictum TaxID=2594428 RepID=A0A553E438_9FLAO|nr:DUF2809 domain-containing protein [Flavobacterium restrictum]TRX39798.1 DUF2809 domain-containing protein [Flavobacterium restrictum]
MKNPRIRYFILVIIVIFLGIISRKSAIIPLATGDLLYAVMIYFGIRMVGTRIRKKQSATIGLLLCYAIEIFQLYQADWIIPIRKSLLGRLILGQGFLWSDLIAYTFGIAIAVGIDYTFLKTTTK